ncbi:MAG TPA: exodeoxyribonuclease III [Tepidiformaceae bacterium]|nr:exodeoxyribonuclease III [Tepidiformaceae bacterium]
MTVLKICSWNVNGLRAAVRTGDFQGWLETSAPDIVGMQEVKAMPAQIEESLWHGFGYHAHWHTAEKAGYSGALLLSKPIPDAVRLGIGVEEFDREGRMIEADYGDVTLITAYFPNAGKKGTPRLDFKLAFCAAFLDHVDALRSAGRGVVFMGDLNTAHTEADLARPDEALKGTGFLPEEREWIDRFIEHGYVDTFRRFHPDAREQYTYWDAWRERRARNVGWRIDYVFVSDDLLPRVKHAFIQQEIMGSDHCPVGIDLEI